MQDSLSYSSLSTFIECPLRFQREKALQAAGYTSQYNTMENVRGKIIHKFLEHTMNHKLSTGDWPNEASSLLKMKEMWHEGFPMDENPAINILKSITWNYDFLEKSAEDSMLLVPQMYREIFPFVDPLAVEANIKIPILHPGSQYTKLHGYIDLIGAPNTIIDWKTRKSPMRQDWLDTDLQATVYAALSGFAKTRVQFVQFIFLKTKPPRIEVATTERDVRHVLWLQEEFLPPIVEQIESGLMPATPGWYCRDCPVKCGVLPNEAIDMEALIARKDSASYAR